MDSDDLGTLIGPLTFLRIYGIGAQMLLLPGLSTISNENHSKIKLAFVKRKTIASKSLLIVVASNYNLNLNDGRKL